MLIDANKVEEVKVRENVNRGIGRPFQCILCPAIGQPGRGFNNNEDLYRHHCQHLNYKPIQCDKCGEGFYRRDHLNRHMQNQHNFNVKKRVRAPNGSTPIIPQQPPQTNQLNPQARPSATSNFDQSGNLIVPNSNCN